jgi:hypothetical protein
MSVTKESVLALRDEVMRQKINAAPEARTAIDSRLSLLRQLIGAITEAETAGKTRKELSSEDILTLLKRERAKRTASADIYNAAGATERAQAETHEADIIAEFLPSQATETQLREFLMGFIADNALPAGGAAIGVSMKALKKQFGDFDAGIASQLVRELNTPK